MIELHTFYEIIQVMILIKETCLTHQGSCLSDSMEIQTLIIYLKINYMLLF